MCIQRPDAALPTRTSAFPFRQALEQVRERRHGRRIAPDKFAEIVRERQELAQLRKQLRQVTMERDILAKATAWFANKDSGIDKTFTR